MELVLVSGGLLSVRGKWKFCAVCVVFWAAFGC